PLARSRGTLITVARGRRRHSAWTRLSRELLRGTLFETPRDGRPRMDDHERVPRAALASEDASRAALRAELGAKVLDAAPVLIVVLDPGGAIQFVNPFFERLIGYQLDEICGRDWFAIFAPEHEREPRRAVFRQSFECASE